MIDYFALGLIHFLLAVAVIRLSGRPDLDEDMGVAGDESGDGDDPQPKAIRDA